MLDDRQSVTHTCGVAAAYPRHSLGQAFERVLERWDIPEQRLATFLGVPPVALSALALCPAPDCAGFTARIDTLARTFGVSRWRLAFVCRAAVLEPSRPLD